MDTTAPHTPAWEAFTVLSFIVAVGMLGVGIAYLPVDKWVQGYLAMGALFSIGATANLAKILRDKSEARARRGDTFREAA